ncbi:MAG TPA: cupin domain-containing protein [Beutenbergiaceae bacterium]|nr:cupin domain-containing protein [Beutenbergiaceae bacterium]
MADDGGAEGSTEVRNVIAALDRIAAPWQPHRVAGVNDYDVKVVTMLGQFVWHSHPDTDELFYVISGQLTILLRGGGVHLGPQDIFVVPAGVEHCPYAEEEVQAMLFEPRGTVNTGDAGGAMTATVREVD